VIRSLPARFIGVVNWCHRPRQKSLDPNLLASFAAFIDIALADISALIDIDLPNTDHPAG
jgi:hypothetical protein